MPGLGPLGEPLSFTLLPGRCFFRCERAGADTPAPSRSGPALGSLFSVALSSVRLLGVSLLLLDRCLAAPIFDPKKG